MSEINICKFTKVSDLRGLWKNEALDFTPWLAENIDILDEELGLDLEVLETESPVGGFKADIYAIDKISNKSVIIENQLEDTNHEHLGKLITYASGKSAEIVIWIVKSAREEHISAIDWLNSNTLDNISFFLCELDVRKIGDSQPAVGVKSISRPNNWTRSVKSQKNPVYDYSKFFYAFKEYALNNPKFIKVYPKLSDRVESLRARLGRLELTQKQPWRVAISLVPTNNILHLDFCSTNKDFCENVVSNFSKLESEFPDLCLEWHDVSESYLSVAHDVDYADTAGWEDCFDWIINTCLSINKKLSEYKPDKK